MHKILVFTDLHLVSAGEDIIGLDPAARFAAGLAHALARHPDASHLLITGDLTHDGRADQYARLKALLADCPLPVTMTIGNHDHRASFHAAFPDQPRDENGFVQRVIDAHGHRLILLDTVDEGGSPLHSGLLCPRRLAWLEAKLDEAPDSPTLLFMHHPPIPTGFAGMDRIGLRNRHDLATRLRAHPQIRQIVAGHVHRTVQGAAGGVPVALLKSPCHQMPMVLEAGNVHLSVDEPGAYGLILLHDGAVIVHSEDFTLSDTPLGQDGA